MNNMDSKLFQFYLDLKSPEAGAWNTSPQCLNTELVTRDYIRKYFEVTEGIEVCNVGVGTGDWDDYLGYWLKDRGNLTSIEIDAEICELFAYRQVREGHPNPSTVVCKSIFDTDLPKDKFDIVTLIGSAVNEIGEFKKCLDACFSLLKQGGHLMFMAHLRYSPLEMIEEYIRNTNYIMEKQDIFDDFPEYPFYICKIKK
nr:class I SAM-dependent methyltransferase [Paenibacillus bovis]